MYACTCSCTLVENLSASPTIMVNHEMAKSPSSHADRMEIVSWSSCICV